DQQAVATLLETWLSDRLFLRLKKSNTFHNKAQNGLSFLGTRIFPGLIRFHPQNARRAQEKLLQQKMHYESGRINSDAWRQSLQSYHGIFSVYGTHGLRKHIYEQQGLLA
ncbi:MAG: hypothetical protein JNJ57_15755, partial [Saprospiraceae bacterium]|nr:hypothetical protein [Saprospiraceae bacterium]